MKCDSVTKDTEKYTMNSKSGYYTLFRNCHASVTHLSRILTGDRHDGDEMFEICLHKKSIEICYEYPLLVKQGFSRSKVGLYTD